MANVKAPKVELINYLPSDPVQRERLKRSVNEAVSLKLQIKDLQSSLKDIRDVEKQDHSICPKFYNNLVNTEFDYRYSANKARKALEDRVEQMTEADILMGRKTKTAEESVDSPTEDE